MKKIALLMLMLCVGFAYAQKDRTLNYNEDTNLIEVTYYHANGQISQTGFYTEDGKLHGDWYSYCQEGNKMVSASYNNGKKVGKWFYWNSNQLKEVDYTNNTIVNVSEWTKNSEVAQND